MDNKLLVVSILAFFASLLVLQLRQHQQGRPLKTSSRSQDAVQACTDAPTESSVNAFDDSHERDGGGDGATGRAASSGDVASSVGEDDGGPTLQPTPTALRFTLPISKRQRKRSGQHRSPCAPDASGWMVNCGIVILATSAAATHDAVNRGAAGAKDLVNQLRKSEWTEAFPIVLLSSSKDAVELLRMHFEGQQQVDVRLISQEQPQSRPFFYSLVVDARLVLGGARAPSPAFLLDLLWHYDAVFPQLVSASPRLLASYTLGNVTARVDHLSSSSSGINTDLYLLPNPFVFSVRTNRCFHAMLALILEHEREGRNDWLGLAHRTRAMLLEQRHKTTSMASYYAHLTTRRDRKVAQSPYENVVILA